ncbi:MAG TPA: hypothetical protein PKK99_13565, partial [Bacteroidia bacterium]|nr:hypothetical protein [Bacteroidia bacterium]
VSPVVLDACAAPGGKSTLLLSILNQQGILVSNEVIQSRVKSLLHNLIKWGYNNHVLTSSDTEKFSTIHNYFDLVLIDAPCSGEGLFRKDQDSIQEWSEHAADLCALRQKRILQNIIPCVKPEGHLIYSTCTYNNLENIEQVHELTTRGMDCVEFEILEKFGFTPIRKNRAIGYQAYPHKVKGEGFFISVLKQTEIVETKSIPAFGNKIKWNPDLTGWEKYADLENQTSFQHNGKYFGFPSDQIHHLETLASITRIIKAGTALGEIKHLEILPDFELSQSVCLSPDVQRSDLERETAIQYLQKNAIANESNLKGYQLISYKGLGLGWAKAIPGRMNNLLPSEYKIKSQYIR